MTEQVLNLAKIESLEVQNLELQTTVHSLSGQLRAQKQCLDEMFQANIQLRASNILLEDLTRKLNHDLNMSQERLTVLEKEKADLQKLFDDLSSQKLQENAA